MKRIIVFIALLICFFSYPDDVKNGYIIVKIDNNDYSIFIDNVYAGKQNEKIAVVEGKHLLEIKSGDEIIFSDKIRIYENGTYEMKKMQHNDKKNEPETILKRSTKNYDYNKLPVNVCFLIFSIFPITNLLGYSYVGHPFMLMGFNFFLPLLVLIPSFGCLGAGIGLLSYKGWKYFADQNDMPSRDYFISSFVCIGVSYLLNLIPLVLVMILDNPFFETAKKEDRLSFNVNYDMGKNDILIGMMLKL